jgi:hypothetical protein
MNDLYKNALVILPSKKKVTIQNLIDIVTLDALTPDKLQWVEIMVNNQLENDNATNALEIKPGFSDYVLRQIIYYYIDAMLGDQ